MSVVDLYVTLISSGRKCILTVFRRDIDEQYKLPDGIVDFATSPVKAIYEIKLGINKKVRPVLREALPV